MVGFVKVQGEAGIQFGGLGAWPPEKFLDFRSYEIVI